MRSSADSSPLRLEFRRSRLRAISVALLAAAATFALTRVGLDDPIRAALALAVIGVAAMALRKPFPVGMRLFADRSVMLDDGTAESRPCTLVEARVFGPWTLLTLSGAGGRATIDLWPDMLTAAERKSLRRRLRALAPAGAASAAAG